MNGWQLAVGGWRENDVAFTGLTDNQQPATNNDL